jgi:phosphoserine aminotransferase
MKKVFNFNPGPAALPKEVLRKAQTELLNYQETGLSVMELSHMKRFRNKLHIY